MLLEFISGSNFFREVNDLFSYFPGKSVNQRCSSRISLMKRFVSASENSRLSFYAPVLRSLDLRPFQTA